VASFGSVGLVGSGSTVPVSTAPSLGRGVPLPRALLRHLLAEGMPILGLITPPPALTRGIVPARLFGILVEAATPLRLGDPESVVGEAMPALFAAPPPASPARPYPNLLLASGGGERRRRGSEVLFGSPPIVALYETNTRDSFWPLLRLSGKGGTPPVSDDPRRNMVAVATSLAEALWRDGIPTVVSQAVNDPEGMLGAYVHSKAVVLDLLRRYPTVAVLLDVDRYDRPLGQLGGAARIALVVGTNARLPDPHWRRNLAFARRLGEEIQTEAPGLLAGIYTSPDSLNQDLFPNALTVAIGGPDNTMAEERRACAKLARALARLVTSGGLGPP
jgi:stage II sporulation protein P